jgi:thiamine biosynthesis lipoprotein
MRKNIIKVGYVALLLVFVSGCGGKYSTYKESRIVMGTVVQITVAHSDEALARRAMEKAFGEFERLDRILSSYLSDSEVSLINGRAGLEDVRVSGELLSLLVQAVEASRETGGAFDVTVGPLVELWQFDAGGKVPAPEDLETALGLVDYRGLDLDVKESTVGLAAGGMKIDLGGIGKGFAVDRAANLLLEEGVENAIIDAGGDLRLLGSRPGKDFWRIGIRHPRDPARLLVSLDLAARAVVTSGDYERFFMAGGKRYHHLLDPATGFPAEECQSVTVVAGDTASADAYATAAFVLGPQRGLELLRRLPGVEGIIVDREGGVLWTDRTALGQ